MQCDKLGVYADLTGIHDPFSSLAIRMNNAFDVHRRRDGAGPEEQAVWGNRCDGRRAIRVLTWTATIWGDVRNGTFSPR